MKFPFLKPKHKEPSILDISDNEVEHIKLKQHESVSQADNQVKRAKGVLINNGFTVQISMAAGGKHVR